MKLFLLKLLSLTLALTAGFLGFQYWQVRRDNVVLRETVDQLESERRELQQQAQVAPPVKPEQNAALRQEIEKQTSELRGLPFQKPVTYKMISRAELRKVLLEQVEKQYTKQELRDYGHCFEALGLIPPGTDLMHVFLGMYDEQVGAFYIPEERALYTFKDMSLSGGLDRMILAHELTHALQDQNYDLTKLPLHQKDNDDLALATSALLEGDATVLMTQYYAAQALDSGGSMLNDLFAMLTQQKTEKLQAAPPYLREMLIFPYQQGQQFAMALQMAGGVAELNRAFEKPPTSTEQILHPEKFIRERDEPTPVSFPVLTSATWRLIGSNVLGEFGIRTMLATQLSFPAAQVAAAGWDGDRYQVYEHSPTGSLGVVWRSVWDDEREAGEFVEEYRHFAEKRGVKAQVTQTGANVVVIQSESDEFFELAKP